MPDGGAAPVGVRTTCPYCGVGCGVIARSVDGGGWAVSGDADHPSNRGRLCSKGSALGETLGDGGRLLHPMIDGRRVLWDVALDAVADGFARVRQQYGPEAIAVYLSGQLLTEDYYVANKLMKGFLGSANVDTNSRLCMASSVAGHRRAFGADTVPGCYADLDTADLIVLIGSNAAWCHPVLFQRMIANRRQRGAKIVVIDPRRTATAEEADLHLAIAPGTDTVLFDGLLVHAADNGGLDMAFIARATTNFAATLERARARARSVSAVAKETGVDPASIATFYRWFLATERTVTAYSQGVHQSVAGTDKVNAIINCHLATGRVGRPGMGPFSLTGQPNAMGGREVGGLANQLAAHMGFSAAEIDRVGRFWQATAMATQEGLKAVEMFDAVADGRIKALWVMATNPAVSLPKADHVRDSLAKLELFVVSDCVARTDTVDQAAILLPAAAWGEKEGTVTSSERRISRQRAFRSLPGEARSDWWIVCEVAKRLGFAAEFQYESPAEIFREHAALTAFENAGTRDLDLSGLAQLSHTEYDALVPTQWPVKEPGKPGAERLFANGGFFTADGKARFLPIGATASTVDTKPDLPFTLNTGRVRDHWHTMTRTGLSPRLSRHRVEPYVEVHPADAEREGLTDGGLARITTPHGDVVVRVAIASGQRRGSLFVPIHWSGQNASAGRIGAVVHAVTDPISGQPDSKATAARIEPVAASRHGFLLSRQPVDMAETMYWSRAVTDHGVATVFAAAADPVGGWGRWLADAYGALDAERLEFSDPRAGVYRAALVRGGQLIACAFIAPEPMAQSWGWLEAQFAGEAMDAVTRRALLSGRSPEGFDDPGAVVCACYALDRNTILTAITEQSLTTAEAIGGALKAGTNCGSCVPELRRLIAERAPSAARQAIPA